MIISESGLLSVQSISKSDLQFFFKQIQAKAKIKPILKANGRAFKGVMGFFEPSTRTQISFESAGLDLGIQWIRLDPSSLSLKKGESLQDTFENLNEYDPDFYVIRHASTGVPHFVHHWTAKPVISAGDGAHEHPTQGLLDAFSLWSLNPSKKFSIAFFGDIARSRVARSSLILFKTLGYQVSVVDDESFETKLFAEGFEIPRLKRSQLKKVDIVYALRIQKERGSQKIQAPLSLKELGPKTFWMHPGPKIMGDDLAADLCDPKHPRSLILRQARNGYLVRRALLQELLQKQRSQ